MARSTGMESFIEVALRRDVVMRALKTAVVVGSVLIIINQGDVILSAELDLEAGLKMALTAMVPYCVSTYASVGAIRRYEKTP